MASMPTARGGFGIAVVNGRIYAIGGTSGDNTLTTVEDYNPQTNKWTPHAPMPTPRSGFAIAVYENKIYVIGGTVGNAYVSNNEVFDPKTNTWETRASMPTPRADLSANVVDDRIYLIGGKKYSSDPPYYAQTDVNEAYDPANDTWTTQAALPSAVQGYTSAVLNGTIYIMGGSRQASTPDSTLITDAVQLFNPQTGDWSKGPKLVSVDSYGAAGVTEGVMTPQRIYCVGGYSSDFSGQTQVYFPQNSTWKMADPMPTPRVYLGLAVVGDVLYAIGGFDGNQYVATNEKYTPAGYGTVPPKIRLTSPENKTYSDVLLSFSVNRAVEWVGYSLDNKANITVKDKIQLYGLAQGAHSVVMYANDSAGNMGVSDFIFFSIDVIGPSITVVTPQNKSYDATDIQLTFILDENATHLSYNLDNGKENVAINGNVSLPVLSDGSHRLTIYATDEFGNERSHTVYFSIATFPMITVVAVAASITIVIALTYILFKPNLKKPREKNRGSKKAWLYTAVTGQSRNQP